jgi:hypothetical protein
MKTVTANAAVPVPRIGDRIGVRMGRHRLVPGGIHDRAVGYLRQDRSRCGNALNIRRVVKRREILDLTKRLDNSVIHDDRFLELLTTVDDAVSHRFDLVHRRNRAVIRTQQRIHDQLNRFRMVGAFVIDLEFIAAGNFVQDPRSCLGHALHDAVGQNVPLIPVVKLIFNRRTTAVERENNHVDSCLQDGCTHSIPYAYGFWKGSFVSLFGFDDLPDLLQSE